MGNDCIGRRRVGAVARRLFGAAVLSDHRHVERDVLVQRTLDLKARVVATGRLTADQRRELDDIKQEIVEWQARTGRNDLSVSTPKPSREWATATATKSGPGTGCLPCPPVAVFGGSICFLVHDYCGAPGDIIGRACEYDCVFIAPGRR